MSGRARPPVWLVQNGRFAGIRPLHAVLVLLLLGLMLIASLAAPTPPVPAEAGPAATQTDLGIYAAVVDGIRAGGDYYSTTADQLRAGDYPLRPFPTFRLPTLAVVQAALPDRLIVGLLWLLAGIATVLWARRIRDLIAQPAGMVAACVLLAAGMIAFVQPGLIRFHEIWAGLAIAAALALREPGRWMEAAALFAIVMAAMAWRDGERTETAGWLGAIGVFAVVLAFHAWAATQTAGPLDPASPGWTGLHGFGLFAHAVAESNALILLPAWLGAPIAALALFGWASMRGDFAARATATFAAYAVAIAVFARIDTFYWALIVAPAYLVGLAFVPDALRDLAAAILDRRRVRVLKVRR